MGKLPASKSGLVGSNPTSPAKKSVKTTEIEKPERLGGFVEFSEHDDSIPIISIFVRSVDFAGKKGALGIGISTAEVFEKHIKEDDQFRYALKDSFLRWLDEIAGVS